MVSYIARVEHSGVLSANLGEGITLITQQTVHVPDKAQILFVPARLTYRNAPLLNGLEDPGLDPGRANGWTLGKSADELVEKLLCADLEVEGVAAILDADVEQVEGEEGDVGVAVVDEADNGRGGLARGGALLAIDEVGDLETQRQVGFIVLGTTSRLDVAE